MSEYWKSLPRKFCEICKCWFADNKASIEFHERGKRHIENAQKRIQDIQKRGIKEFKKQQQLDDDMAKIERAAIAAYRKDLENNAEAVPSNSAAVAALSPNSFPISPLLEQEKAAAKKQKSKKDEVNGKAKSKTVEKKKPAATKNWYEAMSEDGYKYYYNAETSETQWEPPQEGFLSLEEQETMTSESNSETSLESSNDSSSAHNKSKNKQDAPVCPVGPQPKAEPYGQWMTIEEKKPTDLVDLQLPKLNEEAVEVVIPLAKDGPKLSIKEKVIGSLADTDPYEKVEFKKRKFGGSFKRNTRQKFDDD